MPTRALSDEEPQSTASLPLSIDRKFRPWRYSVSHSELRLRSVDPVSVPDVVEVSFYGVVGMKLKTVYRPLTLGLAEPAQAEEMLRFSDVEESRSSRVHCLALKSDNGDGWVACLSYSIWSHPRDADGSAPRHRDSVLILRR
ncbi:hypothetical protein [Streptomyces wuyuanensis]|uniref:hypothetical protein n=1 Tax=Streptomyces wuyuanensis TaxID=1196353 RepID=UPI00341EC4B3